MRGSLLCALCALGAAVPAPIKDTVLTITPPSADRAHDHADGPPHGGATGANATDPEAPPETLTAKSEAGAAASPNAGLALSKKSVLPAGPEPARRPGSFNWVSNTSAGSSVSVQVQLIAMEQEHTSPRFLDTVKVFDHWGVPYANYTPTKGDNPLAAQGVQFIQGLSPAQQGCWTSHASWWLRAAAEGAVITVESDTDPLEAIHELPLERFGGRDELMKWDLISLHDNTAGPPTGGNCEATSPPVAEGMGYATGAMLATGRRELTPQLLLAPECLQDGKIALPVDHWLVCMHDKQLLSIGHACPSVFHQRLGGTHAEQSADDSGIPWRGSRRRRSKRKMRHTK